MEEVKGRRRGHQSRCTSYSWLVAPIVLRRLLPQDRHHQARRDGASSTGDDAPARRRPRTRDPREGSPAPGLSLRTRSPALSGIRRGHRSAWRASWSRSRRAERWHNPIRGPNERPEPRADRRGPCRAARAQRKGQPVRPSGGAGREAREKRRVASHTGRCPPEGSEYPGTWPAFTG